MTPQPASQSLEILVVEDDPADASLIVEALKDSNTEHSVTVAEDGENALALLRSESPYSSAPRPHLILLDLNLPGEHGTEVLAEIKGHPELRSIPAVILTSSQSRDDITRTYELGANAYVSKPFDLDEFINDVRSIEAFWVTQVTFPPWVQTTL